MKIYTIRRWDGTHPNNRIMYRLETESYTLNYDYTSNQTSNFTVTYGYKDKLDIVFGDFIYVPDYKWIGIVKEYNKDSLEITAGDIFNAYQMPVPAYSYEFYDDAAGKLMGYLSTPQDILKLDMFNWSMENTGNTGTPISFSDGDGLQVLAFHDWANKVLLNARSDLNATHKIETYGLHIWVDSITNITKNGKPDIQINMVLGVTKQRKTPFAYALDKKEHRFITDLEITDKNINYNSVILYNPNGSVHSQYYMDMVYGDVVTTKPPTNQYPLYTTGVVYDPDSTQEDPPTPLQVAAGQLPINQSNSFVFKFSQTQNYITIDDVEIGAYIEMNLIEKGAVTRTLKGSITKLEITKDQVTVTLGQDTPRLKLSL
jgi:hypothetical protein